MRRDTTIEDLSCRGHDQHKRREMRVKTRPWMQILLEQVVWMVVITVLAGAVCRLPSDARTGSYVTR